MRKKIKLTAALLCAALLTVEFPISALAAETDLLLPIAAEENLAVEEAAEIPVEEAVVVEEEVDETPEAAPEESVDEEVIPTEDMSSEDLPSEEQPVEEVVEEEPAEEEELSEEELSDEEVSDEELSEEELLSAVPAENFKGKIYVHVIDKYGNGVFSERENDQIPNFLNSYKDVDAKLMEITLLSDLEPLWGTDFEFYGIHEVKLNLNGKTIKECPESYVVFEDCNFVKISGGTIKALLWFQNCGNVEVASCKTGNLTNYASGLTLSNSTVEVLHPEVQECAIESESAKPLLIRNSTIKGSTRGLVLRNVEASNQVVQVSGSVITAKEEAISAKAAKINLNVSGSELKGQIGIIGFPQNVKVEDSTITATIAGVYTSDNGETTIRNSKISVQNDGSAEAMVAKFMFAAVEAPYRNTVSVWDSTLTVSVSNYYLHEAYGIYAGGESANTCKITVQGTTIDVTGKRIDSACGIFGYNDESLIVKDSTVRVVENECEGILGIYGSSMTIENCSVDVTSQTSADHVLSTAGAIAYCGDGHAIRGTSATLNSKGDAFLFCPFVGTNMTIGAGCEFTAVGGADLLATWNLDTLSKPSDVVLRSHFEDTNSYDTNYMLDTKHVVTTYKSEKISYCLEKDAYGVNSVYRLKFDSNSYVINELNWYDANRQKLVDKDGDSRTLNLSDLFFECGPVTVIVEGSIWFEDGGTQNIYCRQTLTRDPVVQFVADSDFSDAHFSDGKKQKSVRAPYGSSVQLPEDPKSALGGAFTGWVCEDRVTPFDGTEPIKESINVYAAYNKNADMHFEFKTGSGQLMWVDDKECTMYSSDAFEYTGAPIKPIGDTINLVMNGRTLALNKDYTVTYTNNTKPTTDGLAYAVIKGKGSYTDTITLSFYIKACPISKCVLDATYDYLKTGKPIKPSVKLKNPVSGKALKLGADYMVSYSTTFGAPVKELKEAGKYEMHITGLDETYSGSFGYTPIVTIYDELFNLKDAKVTVNGAIGGGGEYTAKNTAMLPQGYTGQPIRVQDADVTVVLNGQTLTLGTDYVITTTGKDAGQTALGTYGVVITGKGQYTGSIKLTYKILQNDIAHVLESPFSGKQLIVSESEVYQKGGVKPDVRVVDVMNNPAMKEGVDYTLSCKNNNKVGTATVTIKGKGGYKGSITREFYINAASINISEIKVNAPSITYSGLKGKYQSAITLTQNGVKLVAGKDYDKNILYYGSNGKLLDKNSIVEVGDVITAKIKGSGNYFGVTTVNYCVTKASIQKAAYKMANPFAKYYYAQAPVTLRGGEFYVTVKVDGTEVPLFYGEDYVYVGYKNNDKAGTATVTAVGIGNYTGTLNLKFTISKTGLLQKLFNLY